MVEKQKLTDLEKRYIEKINSIWEKQNLSVVEKFIKSQKIIDSVDKIWASTKISPDLVEYAVATLKIILYDTVSKAMCEKYGDGKNINNDKLLDGIAKGIKNKWWKIF